eukprot:8575077-Pyramimonas_sp.AAC.1
MKSELHRRSAAQAIATRPTQAAAAPAEPCEAAGCREPPGAPRSTAASDPNAGPARLASVASGQKNCPAWLRLVLRGQVLADRTPANI